MMGHVDDPRGRPAGRPWVRWSTRRLVSTARRELRNAGGCLLVVLTAAAGAIASCHSAPTAGAACRTPDQLVCSGVDRA
ncbi:MAG TPA: hypothetical protein VEK07_10105, partial [Polyangiaceae bacterium]|nr:hypothetical protein [Polyangiaceae bacterium]